jgi:hypothetical protein
VILEEHVFARGRIFRAPGFFMAMLAAERSSAVRREDALLA